MVLYVFENVYELIGLSTVDYYTIVKGQWESATAVSPQPFKSKIPSLSNVMSLWLAYL